jgi:hypothetical protein
MSKVFDLNPIQDYLAHYVFPGEVAENIDKLLQDYTVLLLKTSDRCAPMQEEADIIYQMQQLRERMLEVDRNSK